MSRETMQWLNQNTLIGFTDNRGTAWHYRASDQGEEPNHYPGAIPVGDVQRRLFPWKAEPRRVAVEVPADLDTMTHLDEQGQPMRWEFMTDRQAITRGDTHEVMGLFKDGYRAHQYDEWLLGTVSSILGDTLYIGSAGLLRGGAQAWVQVEVPDTIETPEGVAFRPNLLACTSFDGSLATTFKRTFGIVVCDNTMYGALGEDGQVFRAKHTKNSGYELDKAREALAIVESAADDFAAEVKRLCETTVTDAQWSQFLDLSVPLVQTEGPSKGERLQGRSLTMAVNKQDTLNRLWVRDPRVSDWKNTAFGVLQAVNTYTHHEQTVRGANRAERNMANALTGVTAKTDADTLKTIERVLAISAAA